MSFADKDLENIANKLGIDVPSIKAISEVESSGTLFWNIDGKQLPPVRLEAHYFGLYTKYQYNSSHPNISSYEWNPSLAATTAKGAWDQVLEASSLDKEAAIEATSWGSFQIMGFHWKRLGYSIPEELVNAAFSEGGQLDMFARFVQSDSSLLKALKAQDWITFASLYNGTGQVGVYSTKIKTAFDKFSGNRMLRKGDVGEDVAEIQRLLNITADGSFGPMTETAVKDFQTKHGLYADGIVGPATKAALKG